MEVNLSPELEAKLNRKAAQQGRDSQSLVHEAVERLVSYDERFIREVEKGLAAADRGDFVEHEEIGRLIHDRFPG
jgi:predicted transcriptional regulator